MASVLGVLVFLIVAGGGLWFWMSSQNPQGSNSSPIATQPPDSGTAEAPAGVTPESANTAESVYQSIEDAVNAGRNEGNLSPENFGTFVMNRMATQKLCPENAIKEGCWIPASQGEGGGETNQPGAILSNGATIMGLDNGAEISPGVWCNGIWVDTNGTAPPNEYGQDQFNMITAFGEKDGADWCTGVPAGKFVVKPEAFTEKLNLKS